MGRFISEGKALNVIYLVFTKVFDIDFCDILVHMLGNYGLYGWMTYSQSGGQILNDWTHSVGVNKLHSLKVKY